MNEIRAAIIGIGNCASSLVQGRFYYADPNAEIPGLITRDFAGYRPHHIRYVAAFDVDERKVGLDLSEAIFSTELYESFPAWYPIHGLPCQDGIHHRQHRAA